MKHTEDVDDAEWLSPDDLIELVDDDEIPRISEIRPLRARPEAEPVVEAVAPIPVMPAPLPSPVAVVPAAVPSSSPAAVPAPPTAMPAPTIRRAKRPSAAKTLVSLARLLLFFVVGLGLGSIFALGVATALGIRADSPRHDRARMGAREAVIDTSTLTAPDMGSPSPAL